MIRKITLLFSIVLITACYSQGDNTFRYSDTIFEIGQTHQIPELKVNICGKKTIYEPIIATNDSIIDSIYVFLLNNPQIKIEIIKHSDSRGSISANKSLTQKQANVIKTELMNKGISPTRIISIGKGESEPIYTEEEINKFNIEDPSKFEKMHAANRRTIIKIIAI